MAKELKKDKKQSTNEMVTTVKLRYLKISPRKVRGVAHLIKKMSANEALAQLSLNPRKPAEPILKLLKSAMESAKGKNLDIKKLFIKEIRVDKGPVLKRWMPRAQGRATPIHKFTSHIILTVAQSDKTKPERFVIKLTKDKKNKDEHKHSKASEKNKIDVDKEKEMEKKSEAKKDLQTQDKGFAKRIFRRKSV